MELCNSLFESADFSFNEPEPVVNVFLHLKIKVWINSILKYKVFCHTFMKIILNYKER